MTLDVLQWLIDTSCMFLVSWTVILACLGLYVLRNPQSELEQKSRG
jgi:hypothetical protein